MYHTLPIAFPRKIAINSTGTQTFTLSLTKRNQSFRTMLIISCACQAIGGICSSITSECVGRKNANTSDLLFASMEWDCRSTIFCRVNTSECAERFAFCLHTYKIFPLGIRKRYFIKWGIRVNGGGISRSYEKILIIWNLWFGKSDSHYTWALQPLFLGW